MESSPTDQRRLYVYAAVVLVALAIPLGVWGARLAGGASAEPVDFTPVAQFAPAAADMPGFLMVRSGGSASAMMLRTTGLAGEIRRQFLLDEESRVFVRLDSKAFVTVEIVATPYEGAPGIFLNVPSDLPPMGPWADLPVETEVAGSSDESAARITAVLEAEGLGTRVATFVSGDDALAEGRRITADVVTLVTSRWEQPRPVRTLDDERIVFRRLGIVGVADELLYVAGVLGVAVLVAGLKDRGTRRLLRRFGRQAGTSVAPGWTADVRAEARRIRSQQRFAVAVSIGVVLALWFTALALGWQWWGKIALVVGGFLCHAWLSGRLGLTPLRTGSPPRSLSGRWRLAGWILAASSLALLVAGSSALTAARSSVLIGPTHGLTDEQLQALAAVFTIAGLAIVVIAYLPLFLARSLAAFQLRRRAAVDTRRPALLLRSFAEDGLSVRSRGAGGSSAIDRLLLRRRERFEELAARCLTAGGPLRALNDPGARLPRLGAVREVVPDSQWQDRIVELIRDSRLIAVFLARTEFCVRELQYLQYYGALDRAVFVIPPVSQAERRRRLEILCSTLSIPVSSVDWESEHDVVLAVIVHPDLGAVALTSDACDDVSYQLALVHAQELHARRFDPNLVFERGPRTSPVRPVEWDGQPKVWPPGRAPRRKPWYRKWWVWLIVVLSASTFLRACARFADPPLQEVGFVEFDVGVGDFAGTSATDPVYVVTVDGRLWELDVDEGASTMVGEFGEFVSDIVSRTGAVAGISMEENRVGVIDTESGASWMAELSSTPAAVALLGDRAIVSLPEEAVLVALDLATGEEVERRIANGRPVGLTVHDGDLIVTFPEEGQVATVNPYTLSLADYVSVAQTPLQISSSGDRLWAHQVVDGRVDLLTDDLVVERTLGRSEMLGPETDRPFSHYPIIQSTARTLLAFVDGGNGCRMKLPSQARSWIALADDRVLVSYYNSRYVFVYEACG